MKKIFLSFSLIPIVSHASGITDLIDGASSIVTGILLPLAFGLCIFYFFWGIFKYLKNESESDKGEGRSIMVWGVVGMFVVFSIWGIIAFIQSELVVPIVDDVGIQP